MVTKIGSPRAYSGWRRLPAATAYGESGSESAAARHASSAPARPAQKRATPRLSCTTARWGWRPASRFSWSTVPSGQRANAWPTRASTEFHRANVRRASARLPSEKSRVARLSATASRSSRTPSSSVSGGTPGRGAAAGTAGPVGSLWSETIPTTSAAARPAAAAVSATTRVSGDTTAR